MVLTFWFLVNNNHVQDAWVLSGISVRQAYVLQLNRDPDKIVPDASSEHKTLRLILWSLVMGQDSGISLFLKLPPSSLTNDVKNESFDSAYKAIDTIPPQEDLDLYPINPLMPENLRNDLTHLRCVWQLNTFVQEKLCIPRALGQPICKSFAHKRSLIEQYRELWRNYPPPFNSYNPSRFMTTDFRLARQLIGLANIFYHPMMLIHADIDEEAGVNIDVYGALEAGHEALIGFFAMHDMFGSEINGFWSVQHRSFEVAVRLIVPMHLSVKLSTSSRLLTTTLADHSQPAGGLFCARASQ